MRMKRGCGLEEVKTGREVASALFNAMDILVEIYRSLSSNFWS